MAAVPYRSRSVQIFENPYLEVFTKVHPCIPLLIWVPIAFILLWRGLETYDLSFSQFLVTGAAGFLTWTLFEYCLHRFLFHFDAKSRFGKRLVFIFHGNHHDVPDDPLRLLMPPIPALAMALGLFLFFRMFLGTALVEPFMGFFIVGYLCYDYIHYASHHFKPKNALGTFLKQYHLRHHYSHAHSRFGVSSPLWDIVFKTRPSKTAQT